jgi:hypothetical protein
MARDEDNPAKQAILTEWDVWAQRHRADVNGGMLFFTYLERNRRDLLLDFRSPSDKWHMVHSWLLEAGRVDH